jgi:DnaJ homolog subfamily C member 28
VSPQRRDAEGRPQTAHSWESLVERQIREAMSEGAFDDLPFTGERLPIEDDSAAGDWAMAHRMLRNAGMAPPWIESDKEARRQIAELEALIERAPGMSILSERRTRSDLVRIVAAANAAIERLNSEAPTDRQHRRPLDPGAQLARLEAAFRGR